VRPAASAPRFAATGDIFEPVTIDQEFGTITWPGDIDLDPTCSEETKRRHPDGRYPGESFSRLSNVQPEERPSLSTTRAL
jgi:hypothetical protein